MVNYISHLCKKFLLVVLIVSSSSLMVKEGLRKIDLKLQQNVTVVDKGYQTIGETTTLFIDTDELGWLYIIANNKKSDVYKRMWDKLRVNDRLKVTVSGLVVTDGRQITRIEKQ